MPRCCCVSSRTLRPILAGINTALTSLSNRTTLLEQQMLNVMSVESEEAIVDNEAQFDAALAIGKPIRIGGAATGGVIQLTTPKFLNFRHQKIRGPGELLFTMDYANPPTKGGLRINADDCLLENFRLRSTAPTIPLNYLYGIILSDYEPVGHRTVLRNLEVCDGWNRCVAKFGSPTSAYLDDVRIENCFFHTFSAHPAGSGLELMFGLRRMIVQDCRVIAALPGETHLTGYGIKTGANCIDCVFERVYVSRCMGMGIECNLVPYTPPIPSTVNERPVFRDIIVEDCEDFGLSLGHPHGAVLDNIRIKNVRGRGIEIGAQTHDYSWASLTNCRVDGVRDSNRPEHPGMAEGIALDKIFDTTITGGWVKNVESTMHGPPHGRGCFLWECQKCHVHGVTFEDIGGRYIDNNRGLGGLGGYHVVENCVFRQSTVQPVEVSAIWNEENYIYARNNTAFKKAGSNLGFFTFGSPTVPSSAWSENANAITSMASAAEPFDSTVTGGGFASSNLIQTV